jgi:hypothetical protein
MIAAVAGPTTLPTAGQTGVARAAAIARQATVAQLIVGTGAFGTGTWETAGQVTVE